MSEQGRFVDDLRLSNTLVVAYVRRPYSHARFGSIDVNPAMDVPGVTAVFTHADLVPYLSSNRLPDVVPSKNYQLDVQRRVLAENEVAYVGEPVAVVIAESRYVAEDAVELVDIDYTELPCIADCRLALDDGAPTVHSDLPHNLVAAFDFHYGDIDAAFAHAPHVFSQSLHQHRGLCAFPGRPRSTGGSRS